MSIPKITIDGKEYELSTKLLVVYKIQGQYAHKSYMDIFRELDKMSLEQQIDILYTAFEVANPEKAKEFTKTDFLHYYLYNEDLGTMMPVLQAVIAGLLGKDISELEEDAQAPSSATNSANSGEDSGN